MMNCYQEAEIVRRFKHSFAWESPLHCRETLAKIRGSNQNYVVLSLQHNGEVIGTYTVRVSDGKIERVWGD